MTTSASITTLRSAVVHSRTSTNTTNANSSRLVTNNVIVRASKTLLKREQDVPSDGYNLSARAHKRCRGPKRLPGYIIHWKQLRLHAVFETYDKTVQLCPVWKAGTTFIRRLFSIKNNEKYKFYRNPYNISFFENDTLSTKLISSSDKVKRFIFVRNPYSRIFSCYVDKLLAPNPYYWNAIGTRGIYLFRSRAEKLSRRCGHDLTFPEYVKYIIAALGYKTPGAQTDPHFLPIYHLCQPCTVNYDFIGKLESFKRDYPVLVRELNLPYEDDILNNLELEGDELSAIDAIEDTVESALSLEFREQLNSCISFSEVLHRIWWKLQLRGLVSPWPPPVAFEKVENITVKELVELAKDSRRNSTSAERKAYQYQQFREFYSQVDIKTLDKLRLSYIYDFRVFEYDDRPTELFGNS